MVKNSFLKKVKLATKIEFYLLGGIIDHWNVIMIFRKLTLLKGSLIDIFSTKYTSSLKFTQL